MGEAALLLVKKQISLDNLHFFNYEGYEYTVQIISSSEEALSTAKNIRDGYAYFIFPADRIDFMSSWSYGGLIMAIMLAYVKKKKVIAVAKRETIDAFGDSGWSEIDKIHQLTKFL